MRTWVRWSAWLCLSLIFWTAGAESTHQHPNQTDAASCVICVVAHSTRPAVVASHTAPVFAAIELLREEDVIAKLGVDFSDAGIRGPPAVL